MMSESPVVSSVHTMVSGPGFREQTCILRAEHYFDGQPGEGVFETTGKTYGVEGQGVIVVVVAVAVVVGVVVVA